MMQSREEESGCLSREAARDKLRFIAEGKMRNERRIQHGMRDCERDLSVTAPTV